MKKILLGLKGKRIMFSQAVEDHEGSFDWVSEVYPASDTRSYQLIEYSEAILEIARSPFIYFDGKEIRPMTAAEISVDKTQITNDGVDSVKVTIKTDEPMSVIVVQHIGTTAESGIYELTPVKGAITISVNSDCLGTLSLSATGDTKYTETLEVQVV